MKGCRPPTTVFPRQIVELVKLASMAPSKYNTQPWSFRMEGDRIRISPDLSRGLPAADPHNRALYISLGCALENLLVGAECYGLRAEIDYHLEPDEPHSVDIRLARTLTCQGDPELLRAIADRQTTRGKYRGDRIAAPDLRKLVEASRQPGVHFGLLTDPHEVRPIVEAVRESNRRLLADPAFVDEMLSWIRFTARETESKSDGLNHRVLGLPPLPSWLAGPTTRKFLLRRKLRRREELIPGSAALMLFAVDKNDPLHWIRAGRSFERVALTAAGLNIRLSHLMPACDVVQSRIRLSSFLGLNSEAPVLLLRIGYAEPTPASLRRPVEDLLLLPGGNEACSRSRQGKPKSWRPSGSSVHGVHGDNIRGIRQAIEREGLRRAQASCP
ncbi:MAG: hypothetical protein EHM61_16180 [Acidobacteria bacterium]|nr:MAG: hypothetical protein EHM61_16180 [Acidobacteriota bacterium]